MTDPAVRAALVDLVLGSTPEQLRAFAAVVGPEERRLLERAVADLTHQGWRSSPAAMAHQLTPKAFELYPYSMLLAEKFVDAVEGRSPRQIWNLPARYGKSLVASRWGPVYALDRDPTTRLILASYGQELADENAIFVRDTLLRFGDLLGAQLRRDRRRQDRFVTTEGGGLIAAGVGSGLTGFGGDGAIIDDPFKDWVEAHSEAARQRVWNWYRSVLRLRLETDLSWIILVMTRWHQEDLAGMLTNAALNEDGEEWEVVRLPALCDDPKHDPLGRKMGEPLEPRRFSLQSVLDRARTLGSYLAAGLEQQLPAPEEGSDIMRRWWKWYTAAPPRYDDALVSVDTKLKDKEGGDYVVVQAWGRTGPDFWLIDQQRGQWNFATTKAAIALSKVRHPFIRRFIVENTGNGPEVMAELRRPQPDYVLSDEVRGTLGITDDEVELVEAIFHRGLSGLLPENPKGDKRARMRAQTPLIEAGNAHLPHTPWALAFVDEAAAFPNGAHDDMVDCCSQALKYLSRMGQGSASKPDGRVQGSGPAARPTAPTTSPGRVVRGRRIRPAAR